MWLQLRFPRFFPPLKKSLRPLLLISPNRAVMLTPSPIFLQVLRAPPMSTSSPSIWMVQPRPAALSLTRRETRLLCWITEWGSRHSGCRRTSPRSPKLKKERKKSPRTNWMMDQWLGPLELGVCACVCVCVWWIIGQWQMGNSATWPTLSEIRLDKVMHWGYTNKEEVFCDTMRGGCLFVRKCVFGNNLRVSLPFSISVLVLSLGERGWTEHALWNVERKPSS